MINSIEELVQKGDPDRFALVKTAPPQKRLKLLAIYALNLEISAASWRAKDPRTVLIRLQWWQELIDDVTSGKMEPPTKLVKDSMEAFGKDEFPVESFHRIIEARKLEVMESATNRDQFSMFIDYTSCEIMWATAQIFGTPKTSEMTIRRFAWGAGVASYLRAVPNLHAAGRLLFLQTEIEQKWAVLEAKKSLIKARQERIQVPSNSLPVMLTGWRADTTLRRANADIGRVMAGELNESEIEKRFWLLVRSLTGKW